MMSMGEKNLVRVRRESNSTAEVVRLVEEKDARVSRELREQLSALLHWRFLSPAFLSLLSFHSTCEGLPYFSSIFTERNTSKSDKLSRLPVLDQHGLSSSLHGAEKGDRQERLLSPCRNSPFHGTLKGRALHAIVCAFHHDSVVNHVSSAGNGSLKKVILPPHPHFVP